ncbi:hypothetical protein [Duganella sp. HH105]|uniref:hypothetical protein n=1 Tax=Duganella sp. HH105 TaxID=1781067 RepID=UPI000877B320|nr:hypothetical protein [Duganella sp. HH105]OEZ60141.1 hypothetical protein DUGA6_33710 [Duganella sp. HH105]
MSALTLYYDGHRGFCMMAPLRVRMLRPLLAALYRGFARNRYRISGWLGRPACADGVCAYKHPLR